MKKIITILCAMMLAAMPADAKKKKEPTPPAPRKEVRPEAKPGLFGVQHYKDDWYFQICDSLLGRPILTITRYITTPVNTQMYGGEMANNQVLYWQRNGKFMQLRALMYDAFADSTQAIARAVALSAEDPIIANIKIDSTLTDTVSKQKRYSVKVTDLFKGDNLAVSLPSDAKNRFGLAALKGDLSYIDDITTYPINVEVKTVKTFASKTPATTQAGANAGTVTLRLNTSFVLLPKTPMRHRQFDPRVGYFTDSHVEYSDQQQQVRRQRFVTRWRLEPKDPEAYKRGELTEPKKQIVYYIDPATPRQWRKYLIMGVEDWNAAFEQAGFKNAITAREWPDSDKTMSLEDARFSVIRYLASPISNAYGPQVHDPRSGEIIESHVGWYHNVMQLLHDWYFVQAGMIDERARSLKFDDELMGQLIRFVSSHEIGHTLGLRHNMGASAATPVEKLRDKAWLEEHGHTASIMDYARFNYVAQPEDGVTEKGIFPRINDYDKWAIEWGYTYFPDAADEKAERLALNKKTVSKMAQSQRFWFGGEGHDNDPRAQTEDLGDDAMKASDYGVKNLKRLLAILPQCAYEEGDLDVNISSLYSNIVAQYRRYTGHVLRNVGGKYHNYKSVEESGPVYVPEERERQKRALKWIEQNVVTMPAWLIEPQFVARLTDSPESVIRPLANQAVTTLVSAGMFDNLCRFSHAASAYQPAEYVNDLVLLFFRKTATGAKLTGWDRYMQQRVVDQAISAWKQSTSADANAYLLSLTTKIRSRLAAAHTTDEATRAHYQALTQKIKMALDGK